MTIFDFKKENKEFYRQSGEPTLIEIPPMEYIMVEGFGDPNNNQTYQNAIKMLYAISYTIKMSKNAASQPVGYFDFIVPPLEGLWSINDNHFDYQKRDNWVWKMMIRQPLFVTPAVFAWAKEKAQEKYPDLKFEQVYLATYNEGLCVQIFHKGPYSEEPKTLERVNKFINEHNLIDDIASNDRMHHEIYLSDPRRVEPSNYKTIIRHPVKK